MLSWLIHFLLQIVPTLLILGVLIAIHELGHFIACRLSGVGVQKFSIGFGPELFSFQGKRTRYSLSLIPIGGFVKPQGETEEDVKTRGKGEVEGDYLSAIVWRRIFIVVSGVAMNYLFAYLIFVMVLCMGRSITSAKIGKMIDGYPAQKSGLMLGDVVTRLNGKSVKDWQDLTFQLSKINTKQIEFSVRRSEEIKTIMVEPIYEQAPDMFGTKKQMPRVGILPSSESVAIEKLKFPQATIEAARITANLAGLTYEALFRLFTGRMSIKSLSGPIVIVKMAGDVVKLGVDAVLQFTALLSISLAVINLLPIPALDGGHLVFLLIEWIFRRPVSIPVQERITTYGFYLLMVLMVVVFYNDLINVGVVEKLKHLFMMLKPS
ncbi:MAG: RIP metalloprotease RseP [Omnitrophica bacterium RIFCSPLOWO2_12_FULL_44_17]|uniref:Zinc metalloprotease n=1 Tax=Candidatus Danuiimicrobium aquiferis TaxID=1801832 RepID=A0A1G1KYR9_9BACT|nr:MAG: RIP metalloprotease RseP [Omnitrophica bacterium RIFCSPHIGHO2_02_FULL_45_28]OGW88849.1 MAG: RIP metalloprotease RseP [Omnitrophica bacterium RIFCSPHIGHO2_12_FULL_44_12]OGW98056.1 MAG: RIP metalloprotease RseP [Omnitrophica bacterium RIFCSPLOWO2_12_FULL_44_17]OGX03502.1 MAG: RIP metalloprotease RseP [Omnitrophica bacterium RIFCSPLOWO2_02_FULL_44_11]